AALVRRGGEQALPEVSDAGTGTRPAGQDHPRRGHATRRGAAQDEWVEAVEGADRRQRDLATLRRVRVHIGEVRKVWRQGRLAQDAEGSAARYRRTIGPGGGGCGEAEQQQGGYGAHKK